MKGNKTFNIDAKTFEKLKEIAGEDSLSSTIELLIETTHAKLMEIKAKQEADEILGVKNEP